IRDAIVRYSVARYARGCATAQAEPRFQRWAHESNTIPGHVGAMRSAGRSRRGGGDRAARLDHRAAPLAVVAVRALGLLLASRPGYRFRSAVVPARPGPGANAGVAPHHVPAWPRFHLRRVAHEIRIPGAAHVLPEPRATSGDASFRPVPDRAELAGRDDRRRHAAAAPALLHHCAGAACHARVAAATG